MSTLLAIGTRKGLWLARSDDDRRTWSIGEPQFLMNEVAAVAIDSRRDPVRLLIGTSSEHWGPTVMWSDDLGASWQETEHGAIQFPPDTEAALARVWQLQPDSAGRPDLVWAGCEPTSLWRSDDGGVSFDLVRGLWDHPHRPEWEPGFGGAAVHTVVPDPNSSRVLAAMSAGGVYITDDGESWRPSNRGISAVFMPDPYPEFGQCVHKVAAGAGSSPQLYAQNHHGVYRSDDAGDSWTSIAEGLPADFGFPVLADPRQPGTAWVVPLVADGARFPPDAKLAVHRTRDGGNSWEELDDGLPSPAWTVVLRDAACLDSADPTGVYIGTRDGSLYGSANEGDRFALIADHLPDILSVRAAEIS